MQGKREKGFTLLELMIVVVIIAVLAGLAIFNYNKFGFRARRSEGQDALSRIAAAEERYYTNFNQYATDLTKLSFTSDPYVTTNGYYSVSAAVGSTGDTQTYILTGAPQIGQAADACGNLTIDNTGQKKPLPGVMPANSNGSCW